MQPNEHLKKVLKILILAFLCSEMQTTFTYRGDLAQQHGVGRLATKTVSATKDPYQLVTSAPSHASIRLLAQEREHFGKGHICSGALVAPSVVLTVSDCLYNINKQSYYHPAELNVMLGSTQRFAPGAQTLVFGVTHVRHAPKEVSILLLDRDVPATQAAVQPIALPGEPGISECGNNCQVIGWGLDSSGRELHELLALKIKSVRKSSSQKQEYDVSFEAIYSSKSLLAQDAGAPLLQADYLLGLQRCADQFVEISQHSNWIRTQIGDGTNQNSAVWGVLGFLVFTAYVLKCSLKSRLI